MAFPGSVVHPPCPSKHTLVVLFLFLIMPYFAEATLCDPEVARMSLTTLERMLVAAVSEVALRFVCTPTGTKPNTAIKQKAATPRARVNSTRENEATERKRASHLIDFNISAEAGQLNRAIFGVSQCRGSCAVCLLKAYFDDSSHVVIIVLWPAFAARAELNHLAKDILRGSFGDC